MGNDNVYQPGFMTRRSFVKAAAAASGAAALAGLVGCGTQAASGAGMVSTCSKLPRRW